MNDGPATLDPRSITRPADVLLQYYAIVALLSLVAFPVVFPLLYFKFHTLRYRFDEDGVWMSWGILFRKEINLTYRRIQDIHLTRNIIQRWMGLATVSIQTASGSAEPEMQIEGVLEYEALRDYLYMKMRGARGLDAPAGAPAEALEDEALVLLRRIAADLAALRERLGRAGGAS